MFPAANRVKALPAYIFSEINRIKSEAAAKGTELLSVAIGDPDLPTPEALVKKIQDESAKPENHAYSPYEGTLRFRNQAAHWMQHRFGVELNPAEELIALIGSKEGIAHFPQAFLNPGDVGLFPDPGYPIFQTSILLAGAEAMPYSLKPENRFLPDSKEMEDLFKSKRPKYCLLNFPSNPTSQNISLAQLADLVGLARKYGVILGYDNAYSEIYFSPAHRPHSILEIPGAKDIAIEFHSFSKAFSMTGWRLGFACGNRELVQGLLKIKTNIDSGPLLAVQEAGVFALWHHDVLTDPIRATYQNRRDFFCGGLSKIGIEFLKPETTFFVWCRVPTSESSMEYTKRLIEQKGLVVTPGIGFGRQGEGFFRVSLTVPEAKLALALERLV